MRAGHLGETVIHQAREPLTHNRRSPVHQQLRRRADGGCIEPALVHRPQDERDVIGFADRGARLHDHLGRRIKDETVDMRRPLNFDHLLECAATDRVHEKPRSDVEMDVDSGHEGIPSKNATRRTVDSAARGMVR